MKNLKLILCLVCLFTLANQSSLFAQQINPKNEKHCNSKCTSSLTRYHSSKSFSTVSINDTDKIYEFNMSFSKKKTEKLVRHLSKKLGKPSNRGISSRRYWERVPGFDGQQELKISVHSGNLSILYKKDNEELLKELIALSNDLNDLL